MFEVYIHIPFCIRRCGYCDFNTYTSPDMGGGASRSNYATMAIAEMRLVKRWQYEHGIVESAASTVFFGGGTPTILPADDLARMLHAVEQLWGLEPGAEITTEANPDTVDEDYVAALADAGFTRISFGMQSAVPRVLRTLDRTHTPANVEAGVRAANKAGIRSSVDLIYGTPGESLGDWRYSVKTAVDLGANHISAYALTLEPTTKMGRMVRSGRLPKPDDDDEANKYEIAEDLFSAAGLQWYEVSNWARPGYESQHNLGYWRNVDWAGIGPGAHSHYNRASASRLTGLVQSDDHDATNNEPQTLSAGVRAWDIKHPRVWGESISSGTVPWQGQEAITAKENLEELIMLGLRLHEGLDLNRIDRAMREPDGDNAIGSVHANYSNMDNIASADSVTLSTANNHNDFALRRTRIAKLADDGLLTIHGNRVVPTLRGRLLNDYLIEQFFDMVGL
ncbi:MAG: radical SAM family heme chaperone HemW [Bifidobacterium tibiigranuli]|jgi:oxygen-independent coproporphyrinogen-3 oxidase|uniref:radical SAM family heme chaperone HemW n=1 Tax=Bifidobacterium tibiigranuli TaxID=2172043 RepID=UPI0026F23A0B|nr:radical SAM family heme chaperone HemW [Bifidobacterium tibiigranuli]MCI1673967.1 radical SAM family heme chaperone HemW [Bifidobacterium tibiigranuli]MCI1714061.1 radical SAM family heme chaperone HemW [Bifidobacterium tibiigranuli]MCI1833450.1 radical SAM family heme chaperone HemW [Bifidobacterium tibiigranuli]